jgi:hypothetical protein
MVLMLALKKILSPAEKVVLLTGPRLTQACSGDVPEFASLPEGLT